MAYSPQSRHSVFGNELMFPGAVERWIQHVFLRVQPVIGGNSDEYGYHGGASGQWGQQP